MKKIVLIFMLSLFSTAFAQTTQTTVKVNNTNNNTTVTTVVKQGDTSSVKKDKQNKLGSYEATKDDFSLMVLMYRWAEINEKSLHWDSLVEVNIDNHDRFNEQLEEVGITSKTSLKEAMSKTLAIISEGKPREFQLKVCPFNKNDAEIVVRPIDLACD